MALAEAIRSRVERARSFDLSRQQFLKCTAALTGAMAAAPLLFPEAVMAQETEKSHFHQDRQPVWSPDGTRIAFISNEGSTDQYDTHLWVMDRTGNDRSQLTQIGIQSDPSWSPDGTHIVFSSRIADQTGIWTITQNKNEKPVRRRLTEGGVPSLPAWSPDGNRIAFALGIADERGNASYEGNEIWIMDSDGNNPHRLVRHEFTPLGNLTWSPDGKYLAIEEHGDTIGALWAYDQETDSLIQVEAEGVLCADWSPAKGDVLTFAQPPPTEGSHTNLVSHHIGQNIRWVTAYHPEASCPGWSQDGYGLAYRRTNVDRNTPPAHWSAEIRVERLNDTQIFPLASAQEFSEYRLRWNKQGFIVYAASDRDARFPDTLNSYIHVITPQGERIQITGQN